MSDDERARILRMVAEGTISPEEATELLEAVEPVPHAQYQAGRGGTGVLTAPPRQVSRRSLVIEVHEGGETKVQVRIPLALARVATRFIPRQAQSHLAEYGIDLIPLLEDLGNNGADGTLVEINDNEDKVRIAVE